MKSRLIHCPFDGISRWFHRANEVCEANGTLWKADNYGGNWVVGMRGEF